MKVWEYIGYLNLALCIIGQITVGYFYLFAQFMFLIANGIGVARQFILRRPAADKLKDLTFFAITIALICLRIFQKSKGMFVQNRQKNYLYFV